MRVPITQLLQLSCDKIYSCLPGMPYENVSVQTMATRLTIHYFAMPFSVRLSSKSFVDTTSMCPSEQSIAPSEEVRIRTYGVAHQAVQENLSAVP